MKWLKYKLFLILVSAIFGGGLAFFVSSASGGDITTDPLVLQQTNRANWEPGGVYFPGAFSDRGSIIARGGNVTTTLTSNVNVGGWTLQNANILGQYTYTNDLTANHPHTVHSPFNVFINASDSVSASGSGRQVTVNMSWNGAFVHPANGYDGPQGGGYPAPVGGIDLFTFDITGSASGTYLIPAQEQQQAENSNERFNPLTDLTVPTNIDTSPRVGGSPNSGSGVAQTDQTGQSGNDLTIQQNRNPTGYRQTEQQRLGGGSASEAKRQGLNIGHIGSVVFKTVRYGAGAYVGHGLQQNLGISFDSPEWATLSNKLHAAEKVAKHAKMAGLVMQAVKMAIDLVDVATADSAQEFGDAINKNTRNSVTFLAGLAGAKGAGLLGIVVGGLVTAPVFALVGGIGSAYLAGKAYDTWFSDLVTEAATDFYTQSVGTGSVASNAGSAVMNGFENVIRPGGNW